MGTIWIVTSSGVIARRMVSEATISTAPSEPRTTAATKPSTMPSMVATMWVTQPGPNAISRAMTRSTPGRMNGGGRRIHTEACHSASTAAKAMVGASAPRSRSRIYLTARCAASTKRLV